MRCGSLAPCRIWTLFLWTAFLSACTACGCAATQDERIKEFNDDGLQLFGRGNYSAARESFEMALTLGPRDPAVLYNIGQCEDRLGNWRQAEQYYVTCLEINSNHGDARHGLASLLYRSGRAPEARRMIEAWLQAEPGRADAVALDGWRLRREKALPEAQTRLQQALALEPNHRHALIELGIVYEQLNMPERALVLYERALAKNPHQPELRDRVDQLRQRGVQRPLPD
jgi:tetratricopeptide (TPR) repeat protein